MGVEEWAEAAESVAMDAYEKMEAGVGEMRVDYLLRNANASEAAISLVLKNARSKMLEVQIPLPSCRSLLMFATAG